MTFFLDLAGPAVWRASWQAVLLAIAVALLVWCLGERLPPRVRFLLWGVVLVRLLCVVTPAAPWSGFNLASVASRTATPSAPSDAGLTPPPTTPGFTSPVRMSFPEPELPAAVPVSTPGPAEVAAPPLPVVPRDATVQGPPAGRGIEFPSVARVLTLLWLAGCLVSGMGVLVASMALRHRLAACRPVTEPGVLELLRAAAKSADLRRVPALLVAPGEFGPCVVGTFRPRIVLPESLLTRSSAERLGHVLAHELAHVVRGDLWTNWLLLAARSVHWFNPVAWWVVREMRTEREAACDDLALAASGDGDRERYASTILELAAGTTPSPLVPGLVGFFSSASRLEGRVRRLVGPRPPRSLGRPAAAGLVLCTALAGLTDATPPATAGSPQADAAPAPEPEATAEARTHTVSGKCVGPDGAPAAGVTVRLFRADGRTGPPVKAGEVVTAPDGGFAFEGLEPPRPNGRLDRLTYEVHGFFDGRPFGDPFLSFRGEGESVELRKALEASAVTGRVVDAGGKPVAGAVVMRYSVNRRPTPGVPVSTTDADGRFRLEAGRHHWPDGSPVPVAFVVRHPDYPEASGKAESLPADVTVTLAAGCVVTGTVTDAVTGRPAAGAEVTARRSDEWGEEVAAADAAGRFRLVVPEGRYDFLAHAKDRVCVASTGHECLAGETADVSLKLIGGGFIAGRIIDSSTGKPIPLSDRGEPVSIGLFGPSEPVGEVISQTPLAEADGAGRFTLRAAPGENFPYTVNIRGDRMAWDTRKQPPVVVREGATTEYDMLVTPPVSPQDKLKAARKLIAELPADPAARTERILAEFRKLSHTVDETELWCSLMREFVAVGRDAVPAVCAELDRTADDRTLRRLAFALRAIGDPRAVPALVRALPRTLQPPASDYGLIVEDAELTAFMQTHDLDAGKGGRYFGVGRAVREVVGALHKLTGEDLGDAEVFGISRSEDPRRQVLQRRLYRRQAERWRDWWEANAARLVEDVAYRRVGLERAGELLPPAAESLGKTARLGGGVGGAVISPPSEEGRHAWHAYDLDTGHRPAWPSEIPVEEAGTDPERLEEWASRTGVDLICVTRVSEDGTETYVLRALGMTVREIDRRELRNLDRLLAAGTPPEGRPAGDLLMHFDESLRRPVPDADAAFLYVTREGNRGVIETTDRVTRTADLTGQIAGNDTPGVGFHKGVRFDHKEIIP